jgi:CheY-like chemotaxis protein
MRIDESPGPGGRGATFPPGGAVPNDPAKTVLVVEDDPAARDALVSLLTTEGYAVCAAADGPEALLRLTFGPPPRLIILDLLLPVMDGWSLCEMIRSDPTTAGIPVIVCSGAPAGLQASGGMTLAAQEFHPKPVRPDELLASVRRLCA